MMYIFDYLAVNSFEMGLTQEFGKGLGLQLVLYDHFYTVCDSTAGFALTL